MINKRTMSSPFAAHFHTRLLRRNSKNRNPEEVRSLGKMRLQVASYHWLSLLLINLITQGLTADQKKHDFRRTLSGSNSLMDTMMKKYSYPKSEVTAGVGYGHHLHPLYYQGTKEMMYPCAVECGEWESMHFDDNSNDASSNVDVVTVRPDISAIDITTPKPRPYKDISLLRPKKYQSPLFSTASTTTASTPKTPRQNDHHPYQDSKGADVQIIPQKSNDQGYLGESETKESPNDGSLYARYRDALVSGYEGELNTDNAEHRENEYFDPIKESIRYNSPSFNDPENDDMEAPVHPSKIKSHPKRERIEEKYIKHNVREEHLEDVRTNSFGSDDYPTDSTSGKPSSSYNPSKYIDDYAAPVKPYYSYPPNQDYPSNDYKNGLAGSGKPFRPSPPQGEGEKHAQGENENLRPSYNPGNQDFNGYSDYNGDENSGEGDAEYDEHSAKFAGAYLGPKKPYNTPAQASYITQGRNNGHKHFHGRLIPGPKRRPLIYARNRKYPPNFNSHGNTYHHSENLSYPPKFSSKSHHGYYPKNSYSENGGAGDGYYPYAPRHGYSPQSQNFNLRNHPSRGIRVVPPPRIRGHPPRHGKHPFHKNGVRTSPYVRGQKINYRRTIPQKDGFTKIIKKYRSFVDNTPKRYAGSGEPYVTP